jgi:hypothetical protein
MSVPLRLAAFAVILVLAFGGGWAIGSAAGPFGDGADVTTTTLHPTHSVHGGGD